MRSIVTIGGGTGQFGLLSGLKKYPVRLTAIVSMMDDGGSTGRLRDELGVLPPGDIRQCLVALSDAESVMRDLFTYRFDTGGLHGHNFGNIFLSALEKITGSFEEAVRVAGMVLKINGEVIPVTTQQAALVCGEGDAKVCGEHAVNNAVLERETLRLEPEAYANPKAVAAIEAADCIVIGPGNFYCSIMPNLMVRGVSEAIARSGATVVYNCNLMTKAGHTEGFTVRHFVDEIERRIGAGRIDFVTYNSAAADAGSLERYRAEGELPVATDIGDAPRFRALGGDYLRTGTFTQASQDAIRRSLIRHDADRLAAAIVRECLGGV